MSCRYRDGVSPEGGEEGGLFAESLRDLLPGDDGCHRVAIAHRLAERDEVGLDTKALVGPQRVTGAAMPLRVLLETIREVVGSDARFRWVPDEVLLAHAVQPYAEMPFWIPASLGARAVPIERALASGLALRPFTDTVRDTWAWLQQGWDADVSVRENRRMHRPGGMTREREQAILAAC